MTKRSHDSSSSKPEIKQKVSVWEAKRKLAEQRLQSLENMSNNVSIREESVNKDTHIIRYEPKEEESVSTDLDISVDVSTSALERAQDVQASLSPKVPSFTKRMLKSHMSGGFWLGLPSKFCIAHLPLFDETVVLVDENGEECSTKYLAGKTGLSGGWRGFSLSHDLLEGDVLVFQLIQPCKFKIYIVRARKLSNVDRATNLLNLNSPAEPIERGIVEDLSEEEALITKTELVPAADQYENDDMKGIEFYESRLSFKDVKGIKDFKIQINGLIIDSEIPFHLRTKYYKLCCSQNVFLHDNLISGLNSRLVAGAIYETINIADAIRAAKPSIDLDELENWDRTLKAFEDLGMVVGFLRARIHKLLSVSRESLALIQSKRDERSEAEEEMRSLKAKLSDVEKRIKRVDSEIDALAKSKEHDVVFQKVVGLPW
ncbi:hypothetical protein ACS0TY_016126 [Phlomoides rotata]